MVYNCYCRGLWRIEGDELDLGIGVTSILSFNPTSLAARFVIEGTYKKKLPTASPIGIYGCIRADPLLGEVLGTTDPSEIGTSAGSREAF